MTTLTAPTGPTVRLDESAWIQRPDDATMGGLTPLLIGPRPPPRPPRTPFGARRGGSSTESTRSRSAPRQRILAQLIETPGLHLRALQRCLDIELSTLEHHLGVLRHEGRAASHSYGHFKAYYPVAGVDRRDWEILFFLHQEKAGRILRLLATDDSADHARVAGALGVATGTCSFHLKKLHQAGLLDRQRSGHHILWSLREPRHVEDLIWRQLAAHRLAPRAAEMTHIPAGPYQTAHLRPWSGGPHDDATVPAGSENA